MHAWAQNLLALIDVNIERSAGGICQRRIRSVAHGSSILAIAAVFAGCAPAGPPAAVVAQHLHQRLASTDDSGPVGGEALLEPRAVARFYQARQSRPAWDGGDTQAIVEAIRGVGRDGLEPRDYHLEAIEALIDRRKREASADHVADLDVLLTDAVAGMADHMRYGKVRPSSVNPEWNVDPRDDAPPLEETVTKIASSSNPRQALEQERPSHFIYRGLTEALAQLREIEARGGWPTVPVGKPIKPGARDPRIPAVRARLAASGELGGRTEGDSTRYDAALERAVAVFQARHRMDSTGTIDRATVAAMNVSVADRVNQVRVNLERARWVLGGLGEDFLLVNLPAFKAYLIEGGRNVWESRTQIGDEAKQTPTFRAQMQTVVFNPDWTVPRTILGEELLPELQGGKDVLTEKHIHLYDDKNQEVDPSSINWSSVDPETFPYTLRQPPEEMNALGRVKFLFPNKYSIYLHDTPNRHLFEVGRRTFSHGCIRIENPLQLAEILLRGQDGWDANRIDQVVATGETQNVALEHRIPVLIVYWTVTVGASGETRFADDIYDLDPPLLAALSRRQPTPA
jgi:murein L,D-transpeptidase YcbB/YkuD